VTPISRRDFLARSALLSAVANLQAVQGGRLLGTVRFIARGGAPLDRLLGSGLDARLFTDLSGLAGDPGVTPAERFFVRTAAPARRPATATWSIAIGGLVEAPMTIGIDALAAISRAQGRLLLECAGNVDSASYGLMSVADWDGAPLPEVLDRVRPSVRAHRVLVSGVDDEASAARTSVPGASWIFERGDLQRAFLALRMNGAPLPPDHGAPVRLVVPNWYGCACIKWVDRIALVPDEAPATSQMREYAARTHQRGAPALARDYTPAMLDAAAMPVRVEKWRTAGGIAYRVIGIVWGGEKPTNALAIRFRTGDPWTPVEHCPMPASTLTWTLWTHTWKPPAAGRYDIVLKVTDPTIRTRRLDLFFYVRSVFIDEV